MFGRWSTSFRHFIFFSLLLALSLAACRAQTRPAPSVTNTAVQPTVTTTRLLSATVAPTATDTLTPTNSSTATPSPSPSKTLTQTPTHTRTFKPTITPTPYPTERLAFVEQGSENMEPGIAFINSDGTEYERPAFLQPYIHDYSIMGPETGIYLVFSPDGRYLAFDGYNKVYSCYVPNSDCFTTNSAIWIADLKSQKIIGNIGGVPSWSPDSKRLVTSVGVKLPDANGELAIKHNLAIYNIKNSQTQHILQNFSDDLFPSWSPDGQWIAFLRTTPRYPCTEEDCSNRLYIVHPDGSGLTLMMENIFSSLYHYLAPAWSPDSQWLAVLKSDLEIVLVNIHTGIIYPMGVIAASRETPIWSPVSNNLLISSDRDGNNDIFSVSVDGKQWINLSNNPAFDYPLGWSTTGHFIAFTSNRPGSENSSFYVMNSDGTGVLNLGHNALSRPGWEPLLNP